MATAVDSSARSVRQSARVPGRRGRAAAGQAAAGCPRWVGSRTSTSSSSGSADEVQPRPNSAPARPPHSHTNPQTARASTIPMRTAASETGAGRSRMGGAAGGRAGAGRGGGDGSGSAGGGGRGAGGGGRGAGGDGRGGRGAGRGGGDSGGRRRQRWWRGDGQQRPPGALERAQIVQMGAPGQLVPASSQEGRHPAAVGALGQLDRVKVGVQQLVHQGPKRRVRAGPRHRRRHRRGTSSALRRMPVSVLVSRASSAER